MCSMRSPSRKPPPPAAVVIERVGVEGDGVGHLSDGTAVYVPRALPRERVLVEPVRSRGDGWLAHLAAIEQSDSARVAPPCQHFGLCGGCVLQHWRDAEYSAWKQALLEHALIRSGFPSLPPISLLRGLPGERRRLDFAVRRAQGRVILGLHTAGSPEVVDLSDCLVLHPVLMALIPELRTLLAGLGTIRREGSAIANLLDAGPDLLLRTDAPLSTDDRSALTAFARAHGLARLSWAMGKDTPETICQFRPAATALSGVEVRPPPGAFLQATEAGEAAIVAAVRAGLPDKLPARARIAELYAGCGTLSFALAPQARISAYEGDAATFGALQDAANRAGLAGRVDPVRRDLARQPLSAKELAPFTVVVLDPPHAGAAAQISQIAASTIRTVIYVSCNPATLGRDAMVLRDAGYGLTAATAIDQFLWSARLESVCVFRKA
jgi:23S rRNA (uracil1939-C5)-methyltransferase